MNASPRAFLRALGPVVALYLGLALVATYPMALRPYDRVNGLSKEGSVPAATPPLSIWSMGVVLHELGQSPAHLFDGNAFYPYKDTLAFSEHLFVPAFLGAPVFLATRNPVLAYNAVVLLTLCIAGTGMYLLALHLTAEPLAAFGAGVLYAFHTWNVNELQRLQILSNEFFPFALYALLRYFERPSWGRAALAGLFTLLQALCCMYWALYLPFVVGGAFLALEWRARLGPGKLVPLALCLAAAALLALPFALPYLRTARDLGFERPLPESLQLGRYLQVLHGNVLYRRLLATALPNQNAAHFLGFLALALAAVGLVTRPVGGQGRGLWAGLLVAGFLLSLGPEITLGPGRVLSPGPYLLLRRLVPGFRNVRYPERLSLLLVLGLCPLVAFGLAWLRPRLGRVAVALLTGVLFLEHLALPQPLSTLPSRGEVPAVYSFLKTDPGTKVVAEVPAAPCWMERADALPMYFSTFHWKRIVEGYTSYFPPTYNFMKWRLFHFPDAESVRFLAHFGVDTVVVKPGEGGNPPAWVRDGSRWDVVGSFPEGHLALRLKDVAAEPFPLGTEEAPLSEVPRAGWIAHASAPGAGLALDGDPHTAWVSGLDQHRGQFFQVRLSAPATVARVSLDSHCFLHQAEEFPAHVEILVRSGGEDWRPVPFEEEGSYDRFFSRLLHAPKGATLDFDIPPTTVTALQVRLRDGDTFGMPWTLTELRLFAKR
jgi:hypothetical protein